LLKLPAVIQKGLIEKEISMGHARAIINIEEADTQIMIFEQIVKHGFSVRKVEEIVRDFNSEDNNGSTPKKPKFPKEYDSLKRQLDHIFKARISFSMNDKGKGKITIPFSSEKDLERIVKIIENQK